MTKDGHIELVTQPALMLLLSNAAIGLAHLGRSSRCDLDPA